MLARQPLKSLIILPDRGFSNASGLSHLARLSADRYAAHLPGMSREFFCGVAQRWLHGLRIISSLDR